MAKKANYETEYRDKTVFSENEFNVAYLEYLRLRQEEDDFVINIFQIIQITISTDAGNKYAWLLLCDYIKRAWIMKFPSGGSVVYYKAQIDFEPAIEWEENNNRKVKYQFIETAINTVPIAMPNDAAIETAVKDWVDEFMINNGLQYDIDDTQIAESTVIYFTQNLLSNWEKEALRLYRGGNEPKHQAIQYTIPEQEPVETEEPESDDSGMGFDIPPTHEEMMGPPTTLQYYESLGQSTSLGYQDWPHVPLMHMEYFQGFGFYIPDFCEIDYMVGNDLPGLLICRPSPQVQALDYAKFARWENRRTRWIILPASQFVAFGKTSQIQTKQWITLYDIQRAKQARENVWGRMVVGNHNPNEIYRRKNNYLNESGYHYTSLVAMDHYGHIQRWFELERGLLVQRRRLSDWTATATRVASAALSGWILLGKPPIVIPKAVASVAEGVDMFG